MHTISVGVSEQGAVCVACWKFKLQRGGVLTRLQQLHAHNASGREWKKDAILDTAASRYSAILSEVCVCI